ncbi:MAG: hypothetical protein R2856_28765 [Caldilineaceae bacterium]
MRARPAATPRPEAPLLSLRNLHTWFELKRFGFSTCCTVTL